MCAVYDVFRASRKAGFNSAILVFVTDILFWVLSAFATFIFLISRTNGEIRGYVLIGEFIGFALFKISLSRFVFWFFTFIFCLFKKANNYLNKGFAILYRKTDAVIQKIYSFVIKITKRLSKSIKKLLKSRHKVLYTNTNNYDAEYVLNETKT